MQAKIPEIFKIHKGQLERERERENWENGQRIEMKNDRGRKKGQYTFIKK
jgi:hypothetical protein